MLTASQNHDAPPVVALNFPPVVGITGLSELLGKSESTILMDRHRAPHRVPPECTPPECRSPLWLTADVIAWLAGFRRPAAPPPAPKEPKKVGRPTKAEQIRKRQLLEQQGGAV